ncbi:head GIN domain-containing protein [Mucilaginibacter sp. HD30]
MKISFKFLLAGALIMSAAHLSAKPLTPHNQAQAAQTRQVYGFTKINVSGPYHYFIAMGTSETLRIEASKNILPYIVNDVKNGTLSVYEKKAAGLGAMSKNEKVNIYITAREITDINLSGSGNVTVKNLLITSALRLALSGSGNLTGNINVSTVDCNLNGSGNIKLGGTTTNAKVKLAGSGNFVANDLKAITTDVEVIGSGTARVNASKSLNAKVVGTGSVHYNGNPKTITKSKSGGGQVIKG